MLINMIRVLLYIIFVWFFVLGCEFKNEEELFASNTCDTLSLSYTKVKPIFDANCIACHYEGNPYGVYLFNYEGVKVAAQNGKLRNAVNHLPGALPMPNGLPKLDPCLVSKITIWIDHGYPE